MKRGFLLLAILVLFIGNVVWAQSLFDEAFAAKERGEVEKALSLFAEGVNMVQHCTALLNQAEKQVEILLEDSEGRLQTRPASFEAEG